MVEETKPNGEIPKALSAEEQEANKLWQEYLQKCCEVGQILHTIDQIDSQKRQFEKNLEVTQRDIKSLAARHKELKTQQLKVNFEKTPQKLEISSEKATH